MQFRLVEELLEEDANLYQIFVKFIGKRREQSSNPSGSGVNKGGPITKATHHKSMDHKSGEMAVDFYEHSKEHGKIFKRAYDAFIRSVSDYGFSNNELKSIISAIIDRDALLKLKTSVKKLNNFISAHENIFEILNNIRKNYYDGIYGNIGDVQNDTK